MALTSFNIPGVIVNQKLSLCLPLSANTSLWLPSSAAEFLQVLQLASPTYPA